MVTLIYISPALFPQSFGPCVRGVKTSLHFCRLAPRFRPGQPAIVRSLKCPNQGFEKTFPFPVLKIEEPLASRTNGMGVRTMLIEKPAFHFTFHCPSLSTRLFSGSSARRFPTPSLKDKYNRARGRGELKLFKHHRNLSFHGICSTGPPFGPHSASCRKRRTDPGSFPYEKVSLQDLL